LRRLDEELTMNSNAEKPSLVSQVVQALIDDDRMEQTRSYLQRGRRFAGLEIDALNARWVAAFKLYAAPKGVGPHMGPHVRDMEDADAEIRIRGLQVPGHLVEAEFKSWEARVDRQMREARGAGRLPELDPETGIGRRIAKLTGKLEKPKN
jgi:hypothetical protein